MLTVIPTVHIVDTVPSRQSLIMDIPLQLYGTAVII